MRRTAVLLLLLPLVMAPKIAWDLDGLTADVVTVTSVRADRPFPVVMVVENISDTLQEDVILRARVAVDQVDSDVEVVGTSSACGPAAGNQVWCSVGDLEVGERRAVRFLATSDASGVLSVTLDRPGELD